MAKDTIALDEFVYVEVGVDTHADVMCLKCGTRSVIEWEDRPLEEWTEYTNPNYEVITSTQRQFIRWIYLRPDAIRFVNDNITSLCCPHCEQVTMVVTQESLYNLARIWESLECHKS